MLEDERDPSGWVLKALREAGNSLVSELHGLDEETLRRRPGDGDWSLKEIAAHLRDAEELALRQIQALRAGSRKPLPAWDIDVLPLERDYGSLDLTAVLAELRTLRRETTALLWALMPSDWKASAVHPYRGEVNVEQIARELAQHDLEHLWQVRRMKGQLGAMKARRRPPGEDWS